MTKRQKSVRRTTRVVHVRTRVNVSTTCVSEWVSHSTRVDRCTHPLTQVVLTRTHLLTQVVLTS